MVNQYTHCKRLVDFCQLLVYTIYKSIEWRYSTVLKYMIKRYGATQNQVAEKMGLSRTSVSKIVNMQLVGFDLFTACEMLRHAGWSYEDINNVTVGELLGGYDSE